MENLIGTSTVEERVREECRAAVEALGRARTAPPLRSGQEANLAQRELIRARDTVIAGLREGASSDTARLRSWLDRLNAALSLVVGIAYPMSGVERKLIVQACEAVQKIIDELPSS